MRADSTFVNMKDVDIADQGPDMGNNDIAVLKGAEWGRSGAARGGGEGGDRGVVVPVEHWA